MRPVYAVGIGITKFGELWERSLRELITEAGLAAVADAGIAGEDIESMYVASQSAGRLLGQEQLGVLALDEAGLADTHIPATRVEAGDASGAAALRTAYLSVASGAHAISVAGGVEKMTDVLEDEVATAFTSNSDMEWEGFFGATLPALFAMMARAHGSEFGTTREQLSAVTAKNHGHGARNPGAAYRFPIAAAKVAQSPIVADPLRVLDCAAAVDGAAAVVLANDEVAARLDGPKVRIASTAQGSDTLALHERESLTRLESTTIAASAAFERAGISADEVQVAEVHDVFTIAEILALEALTLFKPGEAAGATEKGLTTYEGKVVVNPSGGLKARGHALGATGLAQACEIVEQLRNAAGDRQVDNAATGLTHAMAGTGGTSIVHVFRAEGGGR